MVATRNVTNDSAPPSASKNHNSRRTSSNTDLRDVHDAARLREFPSFIEFSDDELLRLVRAAHHESKSAPWPLIHEHTPSDACYILLNGEVGVYVGRDCIATVGPGEVIGESALRRGKLRSATVTTIGPAEVLRIERDDLAELLDEIPALRETIDASVARHVPVRPVGALNWKEELECTHSSTPARLQTRSPRWNAVNWPRPPESPSARTSTSTHGLWRG